MNFDNTEQDKAFIDGGDVDFNVVADVTPVEVHNPFADKVAQPEVIQQEAPAQIGGLDLEEV